MEERFLDVGPPLGAYREPPVAVQPRRRPLDHPPVAPLLMAAREAVVRYLEHIAHVYFTMILASKRSMIEVSPSHSRQFFRRSLCDPARGARNWKTRTPAAPIAG